MKPIVQQINKDTFFCFTIPQSKEIAKHIESSIYQDSIAMLMATGNDRLRVIASRKDSTISVLETKAENINENQAINLKRLNNIIQVQQKQVKRGKLHKKLLGVGLVIITIIAIGN